MKHGHRCGPLRVGAPSAAVLATWLALSAAPAAAAEAAGAAAALSPYADVRYRLEFVDQDGLSRSATASTLRVRAGLRTAEWRALSLVVEGETISHIGAERYNDTVNGYTQYPTVADPKDSSINQAYLHWRPSPRLEASAGRRRMNLDNQRWIGSSDWRQNDQTLDAAGVVLKPARGLALAYDYVWRVNRIYGRESPQGAFRDTHIHLVRLSQELKAVGTVVAYAYLLDIPEVPASSSQTVGVRFTGGQPLGSGVKALYALEYARQADYGRNPRSFRLDYLLLEPGLGVGPLTAKLGYERLEGDGTVALQTPLATLHAFNGWADKFLTTPPGGLRDVYGDAAWKLRGPGVLKDTSLRLAFHDFHSTRASVHYGSEWDALVSHPLGRHLNALAKCARYDADRYATDTRKFWLALEARY